ncbi:DUF6115 domain-containing protein [Aneurinibacillus sp. UBA3580]|jgi:septal ring factor EnvC (AmiA/AmiB activator)|uniref:DUF6115 domain-containing protein n=1 Tax=Aneurinibacillus sp. UBA3580 TaxID=1946041 RepID=UPI00257C4012|nr:hypothetical protein [Aneurinibacillus sp. UBA3580]
MIEIWLSALTVIVLLLLLRFLKGNGERTTQGAAAEEKLHTLITEFEQENKELVRSIAQVKRITDMELAGVKEELASLRQKVSELEKQNEELAQKVTAAQHVAGDLLHEKAASSLLFPHFLKDDYKDIPRLYSGGMSPHDIARKLGIGDGEVEMVIQMLKKQGFLAAN